LISSCATFFDEFAKDKCTSVEQGNMGARRLGNAPCQIEHNEQISGNCKRVSALSPKARVLQALQIGIANGTGPSR